MLCMLLMETVFYFLRNLKGRLYGGSFFAVLAGVNSVRPRVSCPRGRGLERRTANGRPYGLVREAVVGDV